MCVVLPLSSKNDVKQSMPVLSRKLHSWLNVEALKTFVYMAVGSMEWTPHLN
jgi:hypothetical protein